MRYQQHIGTVIYWTALITGLALLIWALVRFGQSAHQDSARCSDRQDEKRFEGDPDLYGLGIRLGVYLQWIAQFLANCFLLDGWKSVLGGSIAFELALTGAVLIRTFENECVFTVEIIVIMFLFYGGVVVAFDGSPICNSFLRPDANRGDKYTVTNSAAILPFVVMLVFNFWFWIRLATVGETDYVETPGGTFYFLFSRVSASSKPPAQFMVFVCAILTLAVVQALPAVSSWTFRWISRGYRRRRNTRKKADPERSSTIGVEKNTPTSNVANARPNLILMIAISIFSMVYSIVAVELTLVWNHMTEVYTVNSTGQVIPLIVGSGMLINMLLKIRDLFNDRNKSLSTSHKDVESTECEKSSPQPCRITIQDPMTSRWI